jgi:hypothetical protein
MRVAANGQQGHEKPTAWRRQIGARNLISAEIPAWDGVLRQVAELWRMQKDDHSAVCSVWTRPEGVNSG